MSDTKPILSESSHNSLVVVLLFGPFFKSFKKSSFSLVVRPYPPLRSPPHLLVVGPLRKELFLRLPLFGPYKYFNKKKLVETLLWL